MSSRGSPTLRIGAGSATEGCAFSFLRERGQSRSTTLTVAPPTVGSVVTNPIGSVTAPQQSIPVTVILTAPIPTAQSATVSCVGEGLTCPTTVSISGTSGSFTVNAADVPTVRTATINVTFNGATQSTSLELRPLDIKTMTLSPPTVGAGSPSSITLQLNRAAGLPLQLSSSDPSVAVPIGQVTLTAQDVTKLVSITTLRPQTASKTVTITATGTRQTPFGQATVTRSVTLTVVP